MKNSNLKKNSAKKEQKKVPNSASYRMSRIRSTDTSIELILRKALWLQGIRYRKNYRAVPGKPDIAFPSCRLAVFCDSSFWHGRRWRQARNRFRRNAAYWIAKIERNMARDILVSQRLKKEGWYVLRFWDTDIIENPKSCVNKIKKCLAKLRPKE